MTTTFTRIATRSLSVVVGLLFGFSVLAAAQGDRPAGVRALDLAPIAGAKNGNRAERPQMVFVRFETPSVVEMVLAARDSGAKRPERSAQRAHARLLDIEQAAQRRNLEALGATVLASLRVGANGLRIRVSPAQLDDIRALPGVRSVSPVATHTLDLTRSVPWVGAPTVWAGSGDGTGITIAIIDTGLDYLHANFGGSGDPAEYAANDFAVIEPGSFPTAKVIGGWDFAGAVYDASSDDPALAEPTPDPDPLDGNGHGSHVGGIAAGLGVPDAIGPGVAKGASLYAFKVFSDGGGSTNLTADAIERALDPNGDGDIDDHVDVINMSLGSSFGLPGDPSAVAASNAADLGVIVVASAGNSGNSPFVTGSPGVGANVISVAATLTGGDVPALRITTPPADGLYESVEGVGSVRIADGAVLADLVVADPLQACDADANGFPLGLNNDIGGGMALIQRGGCSFDLKYLNAQVAGASAIVVYNDGANPTRIAPITMGGVGNLGLAITIPGSMIASTAGDFLNATLAGGNALSAEMDASLVTPTAFGDTVAGFSSRGPGHGGSTFKPDIAAPGVSTLSTGAGSGTAAASLSGTSMASPHVAGAGALMRQAFPDASTAAIKAMLMNSTVDAQPDGLIGPPHPLSRQGVGVLRVDHAVALSSFAQPAGVSYGHINPTRRTRVHARVAVTNMSADDRTFTITHVPQQEMPGVRIEAAESIDVRAGRTRRFRTRLTFDPSLAPPDDGSFSHREVDGWFVLNDGDESLRVGYFAVVDPASRVRVRGRGGEVELSNRGPAAGVAEGFTLALIGDDDSDSDSDKGPADRHDDDEPRSADVRALGYRSGELAGFRTMEFGIDLREPWESMSRRSFDIYLDVDRDGTDDVLLQATDWSDFNGTIGTMVTAQTDLVSGASFLDWFVGVGDFNDTSAAFRFTRVVDGGLVPDSFDFRLEVSGDNGATDVEFGSIDLAEELIPEQASLSIDADSKQRLAVDGEGGRMIWLFQNNRVGRQSQVVRVR